MAKKTKAKTAKLQTTNYTLDLGCEKADAIEPIRKTIRKAIKDLATITLTANDSSEDLQIAKFTSASKRLSRALLTLDRPWLLRPWLLRVTPGAIPPP